MTQSDYQLVTKLLQEHSGISLEPDKQYLVESRLTPLAARHGLPSVAEYVTLLRNKQNSLYIAEMIEAMVTTETSFFRDGHPYELLRTTILPELVAARRSKKELSIWSAACASGQEPHSLAILLREYFPELLTWKIRLFATDISHEMVRRCREGKYTAMEVQRGLSPELLSRYFEAVGTTWQLRAPLRQMVEVQQRNLVGPWPVVEQFDLILVRNVMIYFDIASKQTLLQRMARSLQPDGYLLLGAAETTLGLSDAFVRVDAHKGGIFRLATNS